jgi:cellulose synthase/poly-beta-1,6-N-acetylglucosamine synthase-like glycosyltransferase
VWPPRSEPESELEAGIPVNRRARVGKQRSRKLKLSTLPYKYSTDPGAGEEPSVTVIMPIRNEAAFIERSLGAVLRQDYPAEKLEVLVADGMSGDDTRQIVNRLASQHPVTPVRIVDNVGQIVPTGMNCALRLARGDVIVRVDGHTVIAADYIREAVSALARTGADNVGGRMTAISEGWFGEAVARATSSRFGVGGARFHYSNNEEWVDTVYLGAWPRSVFERIGLFDEEMVRNQDDEFNYRLRSAGGKILLCPRVRSRYYNRASIRSLWKQYFQYGWWKVRVLQKHPGQMRPRQFAPPVFVLMLLTSLVLTSINTPFGRLALVIPSIYALCSLCFTLIGARGGGGRGVPLMAVAFPVIHVAYGAGFLLGFFRFMNKWRQQPGSQGSAPDFRLG